MAVSPQQQELPRSFIATIQLLKAKFVSKEQVYAL